MGRPRKWTNEDMWTQALAWRQGGANYRDIAGRFTRDRDRFGLVIVPSEDTVRREIKRRQASEGAPQELVVASVPTDADQSPPQDRGVVHRELVRRGGDRARRALAALPPVPSNLIHHAGTDIDWWDAEAAASEVSGDTQAQALEQHAAGSELPEAIHQFIDRLNLYSVAAQEAWQSVEAAFESNATRAAAARVALFRNAVDRACVGSTEYRGSWEHAQGEFHYLTMMDSTAVELAPKLAKNSEMRALAQTYFDLVARRRGLVEQLSPLAVDKWAVDGRCEWCPGQG